MSDILAHLARSGVSEGSREGHYQHDPGYDDYEFRVPGPTYAQNSSDVIVTRTVTPYFVDVMVTHQGENDLLWAAVDHLGIVAFDLSDTWSTQMPIWHQEGTWVAPAGVSDRHIRTVEDPDTDVTAHHAHRLALVQPSDGEESGLVLAVAVSSRSILLSDSILDEGRTLGHLGIGYQGTGHLSGETEITWDITAEHAWEMTLEEMIGDWEEEAALAPPANPVYEYTVLYDLANLVPETPDETTKTHQHSKFLRHGGRQLHLPSEPAAEELLVVGGSFLARPATPSGTFRARYDWPFQGDPEDPPPSTVFLSRTVAKRPGWNGYDISFSPSTNELLYPGSNDGGCAPAGFMATCDASFRQFLATPGEGDGRSTMGILYDPRSLWEAPTVTVESNPQKRDFVFGAGRPPAATGVQKPHWKLVYFDPGEDLCDSTPGREPDRLKTVFVQAPKDRFTHRGRGFYNGSGAVNPAYDTHLGTNNQLLFVSRTASPAGLWVLNRRELELATLNAGTPDLKIFNQTDTGGIYFRELLTHPEFANVYNSVTGPLDCDGDPPDPRCNFLGRNGLNGRVLTLYPHLMRIPAPEQDPRWVLAVPCGAVQLPNLALFDQYPAWKPDDVYIENYDHAMVRVFDVHSRATVIDSTLQPAAYTLLGPRPKSAAVRLRTLTWDERHFLFVTNFTDSVLVWEVTSLLAENDGRVIAPGDSDYSSFLLAEWMTPLSISDDLANNAWHIELVEESWHDGQTTRDEVYVYVAVGRYSVAVLRFLPNASTGPRLVQVGDLRTPSGMGGLRLWEDGTGERSMLVTETHAGLRIFGYPQ